MALTKKSEADFKRLVKKKRPNKHGNRKVRADGYVFDSQKEYGRYLTLRQMEKEGQIIGFKVHPRYVLPVAGQIICTYTPDFEYVEMWNLKLVVEDVKAFGKKKKGQRRFTTKTAAYAIKKKLMAAIFGIAVQEI